MQCLSSRQRTSPATIKPHEDGALAESRREPALAWIISSSIRASRPTRSPCARCNQVGVGKKEKSSTRQEHMRFHFISRQSACQLDARRPGKWLLSRNALYGSWGGMEGRFHGPKGRGLPTSTSHPGIRTGWPIIIHDICRQRIQQRRALIEQCVFFSRGFTSNPTTYSNAPTKAAAAAPTTSIVFLVSLRASFHRNLQVVPHFRTRPRALAHTDREPDRDSSSSQPRTGLDRPPSFCPCLSLSHTWAGGLTHRAHLMGTILAAATILPTALA